MYCNIQLNVNSNQNLLCLTLKYISLCSSQERYIVYIKLINFAYTIINKLIIEWNWIKIMKEKLADTQ